MNQDAYKPQYFYLDEIYISDIVFDESENLSLFGYLVDEQSKDLTRWDFFCGFGMLTDILLFAGEEGEVIIKILSDKLSHPLEIPTVIDVEGLFSKPLRVDSFIFEVYKPHSKNETGNWIPVEESYLYINAIENKEKFLIEQPGKHIAKIIDRKFVNEDGDYVNQYQEQLDEYLIVLDNAFKYYILLINKSFSEKEARKRAGLTDELLYRIAFYNHKIINKK